MRRLSIAGVAALALVVLPLRGSAQDMAAMSKWAGANVIHYHVTGTYSGSTKVLKDKAASLGGKVSDRVEIDFDWDQMQQKIAGDAIFKNFPTKVESLDKTAGCAEPKVNGAYEYFTFQSVKATAVMFELQGKRDVPPGSFQYTAEQGGCGTVQASAASEPVTARMQVPQAMLLAMPSTPGLEMEITPDKKSFIQKINTDGWVWTMTPVIVR